MVRAQVFFYASTPSYRAVLEHHGWGEVGERLSRLASRGQWGEMPREISDEMLAEFAIAGTPSELPARLHAKYAGLLDRVTLYAPFVPGENDERWRALVAGIHRAADTNVPASF